MKVLITGGLGFIGSHTVVELVKNGFEVIVIDNLSNSYISVKQQIEQILLKKIEFENIDLRDKSSVKKFFKKHDDIQGVIHFAAFKAVNESVNNPLKYYENNINSLVHLLSEMKEKDINNLIFSSSCTVYGQAENMPITEDSPILKALSPYGNTKIIGEEIIRESADKSKLKAVLLRYFNPIGAHTSALIGELPIGTPQNLIPFLTQTVIGIREELSVFGSDYPTDDGTAVRDYIHVEDIAEAHVTALRRLINKDNTESVEVFNLGTGKGSSVLEVIQTFEKATGEKVPYQIVGRRDGDVSIAYANTDKANQILGWKAKTSLSDSLLSAWNWEKQLQEK
jgi:UDP-glucose 4-epimerase